MQATRHPTLEVAMTRSPAGLVFALSVAASLAFGVSRLDAGEKLKAEDVITRHLEAVGPADARAAARSLAGSCAISLATGYAGELRGRFGVESGGGRLALKMRFPSDNYPSETFSLEDGRVEIGFVLPGKRSALGNFLNTNDVIVREGLLGGVLNAGWPVFDLAARGGKLSYDGVKKLSGRELHRLSYRAKGQGSLEVQLFFETDTFRHVASIYRVSLAQNMGTTIETSSRQPDIYFQLEESFGDWKAVTGLTLPSTWTVRYENQGKVTQSWKYDFVVESAGK
jgi:hypothetical protein